MLEIAQKRNCSRAEAIAEIEERGVGYSATASRQSTYLEATVSAAVDAAFDRAIPIVMERLLTRLPKVLPRC